MVNCEFGDRLKRWMGEIGITQHQLANELNLSETTLSRYLSGARIPNYKMACKLARAIGVPYEVLFDGEPVASDATRENIQYGNGLTLYYDETTRTWKKYDSKYDVTIHCETKGDRDALLKYLRAKLSGEKAENETDQ